MADPVLNTIGLGWRQDLENWSALQSTKLRGWQNKVEPVNRKPLGVREWFRQDYQNGFGSCTGHGLSGSAEVCYWLATGKQIQFSRWFAYIRTQLFDGIHGDQGATISGAQRTVTEVGLPREEFLPYPSRYSQDIPQAAYDDAANFKIKTAYAVDSYDDILLGLRSGLGSCYFGISWTSGMANAGGTIESYSGRSGGGHCICFVDWVDDSERPYLWLANSHGPQWGEDGYAKVSPNAINQMLNSSWSEFRIISDMDAPRTRTINFTTDLVP